MEKELPQGNDNLSRLVRWLAESAHQVNGLHIENESGQQVTLTSGELFDLLFDVTNWAYWNGVEDVSASAGRVAAFFLGSDPEDAEKPKPIFRPS